MARATATYAVTETTDWEEGDFFEAALFLIQVLQVLEFYAQLHDHSGDAGDGANLTTGDDGLLFMAMPAVE